MFEIVDIEFPYNAIIGRGMLNIFEEILDSAYLYMKIPTTKELYQYMGVNKFKKGRRDPTRT
jgi:hypothetical protein